MNTIDSLSVDFITIPKNIKTTNVNSENVCLFAKWSNTLNSYFDPILLNNKPAQIENKQIILENIKHTNTPIIRVSPADSLS